MAYNKFRESQLRWGVFCEECRPGKKVLLSRHLERLGTSGAEPTAILHRRFNGHTATVALIDTTPLVGAA